MPEALKELYPERLLPSVAKYNSFNFCNECYLCHWFYKNQIDDEGKLEPSAIELERIFGNSNNVIGCSIHKGILCIAKDSQIKLTNNGKLTRTPFQGNDEEVPSADSIEWELDDSRNWFFVQINTIDAKTFILPYNIQGKKDTTRDYIIRVEHKPTLVNLYHFEIQCYHGEILIKNYKDNTWMPELAHEIRAHILVHYTFEI